METYLKKKKNCLIIFRNGQDKVLKRGNGNFVKTNAWKLVSREIIEFLEPTKDWSKYNEDLNNELFWTDHLHLSKFGNKKFVSSICILLQQYKIVSTYPKLLPGSSVVCKFFILSQGVCEVDPPCSVTVDVSTVKNGKYSPSCYNVTSFTHVKVCNFFVSCQMVCEIVPIHVDVVHLTTNVTVKHWNEISLCRSRTFSAPVTHVENVSTYVNKSRMIDCPRVTSFDASSTVDSDPIDAFRSDNEIEKSTLLLLPMLKENVEGFVSFLFMIFCSILTFSSSLFIVNNILTFNRYCFYFIYTDIAYIIYYNFLIVLTNSLSDIPGKLGSYFYVFQTMFLTVNFCTLLKI